MPINIYKKLSFKLKNKIISYKPKSGEPISYSSGLKEFLISINNNSQLTEQSQSKLYIWQNLNGIHFGSIFSTLKAIFLHKNLPFEEKKQIIEDFNEGGVLYFLLQECRKSIRILDAINIAICCNSIAAMNINKSLVESFMLDFWDEFVKPHILKEAKTQELSNVANSIAKLNITKGTEDLRKIIERFIKVDVLRNANAQELANVASSIAKLNLAEGIKYLLKIIERFVEVDILNNANAQGLANVANAISKLRVTGASQNLQKIIERFVEVDVLSNADAQGLANVVNSIANLNLTKVVKHIPKIIERFIEVDVLNNANAQNLANVANSIAKLNLTKETEHLSRIIERFIEVDVLNNANAQNLA